jgi:MYXO-CTERM domain-containing protein
MTGCEPGFICHRGSCIDDPCRYVKCPDGHQCQTGTGACAALGSSGGPGGNRNRGSGCEVAPSSAGWPAWAALALVAIAFTLRVRRNRS